MVGTAAADDLQAGAAAGSRIELDVGGGLRGLFLAAGDRAPLGAFAAIAALAAVERVGTAAADEMVVAGAAVDDVALLVADQGVAESRAFDALEAEELVVAVAASPVGLSEAQTPSPLPPATSVAKEAMSPLPAPPDIRSQP